MKRILAPILLALTFSVMFSSPSFADWTKVTGDIHGNTIYVDFERIRKHGGYVYYWDLYDLLKPNKDGDFSWKMYNQVDCKLFRYKGLSTFRYTQPMGAGTSSSTYNVKDPQWNYLPPDSSGERTLKSVCAYAK